MGQAAAQLSSSSLAVEAAQVAQKVAVGLVVLGQPQFVIEASPHFQVDSGPGQSLSPQPRWVEVRFVERGAQVVQLWKGEGNGEGGGRSSQLAATRRRYLSPKLLLPVSPDTGPISTPGLSVHRPTLSFSMDVVCMEMTAEAMKVTSSPMEGCRMRKTEQQILRESSPIGWVCKPPESTHPPARQGRRGRGAMGTQEARLER